MGNSAVMDGKEKVTIESAAPGSVFNPLNHPISLTYPARIASSGWIGHVPFGMYLIDVLRPNALAELGTHHGVSYGAFCQAVKELGLKTKCYAIDSWEGDSHSGFYGSEVLTDLEEHHNPLYGAFSSLIQSTFDEALGYFPDNTFDLLHIDGFHTYDVVKRDFEKWLPKLTDRGVVLLHDINVREKDFGVWKLWEELKQQYPHFEFVHSHGLGVLAVGRRYPDELNELFQCSAEEQTRIRSFFAYLGARLEITQELKTLKEDFDAAVVTQETWQKQAQRTEDEMASQRAGYEAELVRQSEELRNARAVYEKQIKHQNDELKQVRAAYETQINHQRDQLKEARAAYEAEIQRQIDEFSQARSGFEAQLASQVNQLSHLHSTLAALQQEIQNVIRARDEATVLLQSEQERNRSLSAQLSEKTREVDQITRSLGWQLLSRYGRLKYRYLLPVYRMLGLAPHSVRAAEEHSRMAQLTSEQQTPQISQPAILQNGQAAQETFGQAPETEQLPIAVESNSGDVIVDCVAQVDQQTEVAEQQLAMQALLTQQAGELANARQQILVLQRPELSTITALAQQMEEAITEFQQRMERDPSILDWNSGLDLAVSFPRLAVFSPLLSESTGAALPYLDDSIDIVVTASSDPARIAEARRVAGVAVIRVPNSQSDKLQQLTPRKLDKPVAALGIEWLTAPDNEPLLPMTSIIIPVYNNVSYTQSCLEQLSATLPHDFNGEIIVIDDASSDETLTLLQQWGENDERIKILRNPENLGFIMSCNRGAESAQGDILIFLNNDTLPLSGWLPPLLRPFRDNPKAGAVGGKLVYPDGTLQEAGGVIFSDGQGCNFGKFDKAAGAPLYNFMREVDYCSGALLATRRDLFMELGGFDERFKPAYYEDVDYCFGLRERGYRVYYQPESVIVHFEGTSSGTDLKTGVKSYQVLNQAKFVAKWREALKHQYPAPAQYDPVTLHILSRRNRSVNGDGN